MSLYNRRKRDVEPILAISIVVLLVASGAVVSMSFYGNYIEDEDLTVSLGKEVEVYYTGSLYGYYDQEGALIFDTNVKSNVDNEDYAFIGGFDRSDRTFNLLSFIHGKGKMLAMFEDALTGYEVGDTVRVEIPFGKGYKPEEMERSKNFTVGKRELMTLEDFNSHYDGYVLSGAFPTTITTVYGWEADAMLDTNLNKVVIIHNPEDGKEYELKSNELNVHGSVNVAVVLNGDEIECEFKLDVDPDTKYMLWVKTHSESFYVFGEDAGKLKITERPAAADELSIYFVITIHSVS